MDWVGVVWKYPTLDFSSWSDLDNRTPNHRLKVLVEIDMVDLSR